MSEAMRTIKSMVWEGPYLVITYADGGVERFTNAWFSEGKPDDGNLYDSEGNVVAVVTKGVFEPVSIPTKDIKS
jgi:hypothetical protein